MMMGWVGTNHREGCHHTNLIQLHSFLLLVFLFLVTLRLHHASLHTWVSFVGGW